MTTFTEDILYSSVTCTEEFITSSVDYRYMYKPSCASQDANNQIEIFFDTLSRQQHLSPIRAAFTISVRRCGISALETAKRWEGGKTA
jgi:hypothetical protein